MHGEMLLIAALLWTAQAPVPAPREAAAEESLELRYARTRLALAEANLKRIDQMNKKLDRTVPASVVAEFKNDVATAELQFRQAVGEASSDPFTVWLRRAESAFQSATTRWKNAVAANRRVKLTVPAVDVERYRLRTRSPSCNGNADSRCPRLRASSNSPGRWICSTTNWSFSRKRPRAWHRSSATIQFGCTDGAGALGGIHPPGPRRESPAGYPRYGVSWGGSRNSMPLSWSIGIVTGRGELASNFASSTHRTRRLPYVWK